MNTNYETSQLACLVFLEKNFPRKMQSTLWLSPVNIYFFSQPLPAVSPIYTHEYNNKNEHNLKEFHNRSTFIRFIEHRLLLLSNVQKNFNPPLSEVRRQWKHRHTSRKEMLLVFFSTIFHFFRRFMLRCAFSLLHFLMTHFSGSL